MAPDTPLSLAQLALDDAHRAHDALRQENDIILRALERADEELTWADSQIREFPNDAACMEDWYHCLANYEDIRIIYDEVFGESERNIKTAWENLERIRN
jgi:hypothetical protein